MLARVSVLSLIFLGSALRVQREEKNQVKEEGALSDRLAKAENVKGVTNTTRGGKSLLEKSKLKSGCAPDADGNARTSCQCWMAAQGSPYSILDCFTPSGISSLADSLYESAVTVFDCVYQKPLKASMIDRCIRYNNLDKGVNPEAWANMWGLADEYNPWSSYAGVIRALSGRQAALAGTPDQAASIIFYNTNSDAPNAMCLTQSRQRVFSIHGGGTDALAVGGGMEMVPYAQRGSATCRTLYWENCLEGVETCFMIDWSPFKCFCSQTSVGGSGITTGHKGYCVYSWNSNTNAKDTACGLENTNTPFNYAVDTDGVATPNPLLFIMSEYHMVLLYLQGHADYERHTHYMFGIYRCQQPSVGDWRSGNTKLRFSKNFQAHIC